MLHVYCISTVHTQICNISTHSLEFCGTQLRMSPELYFSVIKKAFTGITVHGTGHSTFPICRDVMVTQYTAKNAFPNETHTSCHVQPKQKQKQKNMHPTLNIRTIIC